ncbi:MAG: T9SS type A sorting domain-containing protein [candidate division Zixibacteria bacterium]|nr:T9SS type A sorting domain-containing protein [candidate division Zixibacteria bacterium]
MNNGGSLYIESANVGYSHRTTTFFTYLGATWISIGANSGIEQMLGVDGSFTAPNEFGFPTGTDADYKIDELSANGGTLLFECEDNKGRVIMNDGDNYRTICSSPAFGSFVDQEGSSTRASVMHRYLNFMLHDDNPEIWASHDNIDFGVQYIDYPAVIPLQIENHGINNLLISDIQISGDNFSVTVDPPYNLASGEQLIVDVQFYAENPGTYTGSLTITSNDPDNNTLVVGLEAECLEPPVLALSQDYVAEKLAPTETGSRMINIGNWGASDLNYSIELVEIETGYKMVNTPVNVPAVDSYELPKGAEDPRTPHPATRGSGGPDGFGYKWKDSDEPGGPDYEWFDISSIGHNSGLSGDDNSVLLNIPFDFEFYGDIKTSVTVSTNGYLTFGSSGTTYTNDPIPDSSTPNSLICPFWDDLHQQSGTNYYYYDEPNRRFIIQYNNWGYYSGGGTVTMQVHLYENNKIMFLYEQMTGTTTSATVGIENPNGSDGLEIVYNSSYVHNELAVLISCGPTWLEVAEESGTIPAGSYDELTFSFDARGLDNGQYYADAIIYSNDPAQPEFILPVTLTVGETNEYITINMAPDSPPVRVSAGGYFTYTGILTNNTIYQLYGDVWIMLGLPDGNLYGPIQRLNNLPLAPNQTLAAPGIMQYVPVYAPEGTYDYIAYAGDYPGVKMDSVSFPFTVDSPGTGTAGNWDLEGWFKQSDGELPLTTGLNANYPNPFNASTTISFTLSEPEDISLCVYNLMGQKVETIAEGLKQAGEYSIVWDASQYSSGVYFYKLRTGEKSFSKRMTLLK